MLVVLGNIIIFSGLIAFVVGFFRPRGKKLLTSGLGFLAIGIGGGFLPQPTVKTPAKAAIPVKKSSKSGFVAGKPIVKPKPVIKKPVAAKPKPILKPKSKPSNKPAWVLDEYGGITDQTFLNQCQHIGIKP
jgi:hypothetical protein